MSRSSLHRHGYLSDDLFLSSSDSDTESEARRCLPLKKKAKTGKSPVKTRTRSCEEKSACGKISQLVKCCLCNKKVKYIAQHLQRCHKIDDEEKRKGLCSQSRNGNDKTGRKECGLCGFLATRLDQHLKRKHKLSKSSRRFKLAYPKRKRSLWMMDEFEDWLTGNAGGGFEKSSNQKVVGDVTNIFRKVGGVSFLITPLEKATFNQNYKDTTIYNQLNSLKVFIRFAALQNDVFCAREVETLSKTVQEWCRTFKKKAEARSRMINSLASRKLTTMEEKEKYLTSEFAKSCEAAARGDQDTGVTKNSVQGHLMLCILLHNFQRPAAVANLSVNDFLQAEAMGNGNVVCTVSKHKTSRKYGAATLTMPPQLQEVVKDFLFTYNLTGGFLFQSSLQKKLSVSSVNKLIQEAWKRGGLDSQFTATKWRKAVVTAAHKQKPEMTTSLAHQMSHSVATARRIYNCVNATENSSKVTQEINELKF